MKDKSVSAATKGRVSKGAIGVDDDEDVEELMATEVVVVLVRTAMEFS